MKHLARIEVAISEKKESLKSLEEKYQSLDINDCTDQLDRSQVNEERDRIQALINQKNASLIQCERVKVFLSSNPDFDDCCLECGEELNLIRLEKFPEKLRCIDCEQ
ncbi:hypothetical protein VIBNIFTn2_120068 [Vibrio nigripulchritudo FTn2]|uniref:TraR/DksA C4-type zinc finger protein n=1 Tax=Vibrio nigripulchritudo TaxID=28173 RepID=UPI0003B180EE|nr:TraR/DksA C4-type zinc finger protein [Vibrio nigripulchritudo]CCN40086.1 hypothetical protein VIBNIFTn2_120068 [Vibrio nigripulchritudo FTn2]